ncbi:DUF4179 domain-containing protein [Natronospora cellulosivora (SeqCode)]
MGNNDKERSQNQNSEGSHNEDKVLIKGLAKVIAVIFIFVLCIIGAVNWIPGFRDYVSSFLNLEAREEWYTIDRGIKYARKHGYRNITGLVVEREGYQIVIEDILFDEERIVVFILAQGDSIEEILEGIDNNDSIFTSLGIQVNFSNFEVTASSYLPQMCEKVIRTKVQKSFKEDEIKMFLEENPQFLHLGIKISGNTTVGERKLVDKFEIKVPFAEDLLYLSDRYYIDKNVDLGKTNIIFDSLSISPTMIRLDISIDRDEYFFTGFKDLYLKDSNGNIYIREGISGSKTNTEISYFFLPSTYFEKYPEAFYLGFEGVYIGSNEYSFVIGDKNAEEIEYMGGVITIDEVKFDDFRINSEIKMTSPIYIWPGRLEIEEGKGMGRSFYVDSPLYSEEVREETIVSTHRFQLVDYRHQYEVKLIDWGYLHNIDKEIEIKID